MEMSSNIDYKTVVISIVLSVILSTGIIMTVPQVQDVLRGSHGEQGQQGVQGVVGPQGDRGSIGPVYNDTREWHVAHLFSEEEPWMEEISFSEVPSLGGITYTSEIFEVRGKELRLRWKAEGSTFGSWIAISVMFANGTLWAIRVAPGFTVLASDMRIVEPGEYYLEVNTLWISFFSVTVWDFY